MPNPPAIIHDVGSKAWPAFSLSALFIGTALLPPARATAALLPPFYQRFGFGLIFSGAGYVLSTGDARNGSGIATSWSLTYLLVNLKRSLKAPRSPLNLALTASAVASSALYGSEYFWVIPGQEVVEEETRS